MMAANNVRRAPRRTLIVGALVIVALLAIVARGVGGGGQPSLSGSWRSSDPAQTGMDPPRTVTFNSDGTVVLGMMQGMVQGASGDVQNTPPLHYTRPDASHIAVQDGPISLTYGYTLTNDTLTLSTGTITFTYHHA